MSNSTKMLVRYAIEFIHDQLSYYKISQEERGGISLGLSIIVSEI